MPAAQGALILSTLQMQSAVRQLTGTFAVTVYSALITFLVQLVAARLLGTSEFGAFAYALSWLTILSVLIPLGFQMALLRFVPQAMVESSWARVRGQLRNADLVLARSAAVLWAAIALVYLFSLRDSDRQATSAVMIATLVVPFAGLVKLRASMLRCLGRPSFAVSIETPLRETLTLLLLGVCAATAVELRAITATGLVAVSVVATAVVAAVATNRLLPGVIPLRFDAGQRRAALRAAVAMLMISAGHLALKRLDVILIGSLAGLSEAGIYSVALRVSDVLQLPLTAATVMVAPRIAEGFARGDYPGVQRAIRLTTIFAFTLCALGALPWLLMPEFLLAWFGPDFTAGASVLRILVVAQLLATSMGTVNLLLMMSGRERAALKIVSLVGIAHVAVSVILIRQIGSLGAAWSALLSTAAWNLAMGLYVRHRLRLNPGLSSLLPNRP